MCVCAPLELHSFSCCSYGLTHTYSRSFLRRVTYCPARSARSPPMWCALCCRTRILSRALPCLWLGFKTRSSSVKLWFHFGQFQSILAWFRRNFPSSSQPCLDFSSFFGLFKEENGFMNDLVSHSLIYCSLFATKD